jgi:hypothetical protein
MRAVDSFSKVVGSMSTFNEMLSCGAKNVALGHPTSEASLRDEYMQHAQLICAERGTQCCKEDGGFVTDLFPAAMNRGKYNILFYREEKYRDMYFALKERKAQLVAEGKYAGVERYKLAYDFGLLLSYSHEAIERMMAQNTDLEESQENQLQGLLDVRGQISFLYFDDLPAACGFFGETLELPLVCDQGWSKIYHTAPGAYVGAVDRSRGACKATTRDGVLTSLVVKNAEEMYERLIAKGIEFERPPKYSEALKIRSMMFVGPEGYKFEVEEFLSPDDRKVFYGANE